MKATPLCVVVPMRGIASGKSRLASVLDASARAAFNEWLLEHTLAAVRAWRGDLRSCIVVSACERVLGIAGARGAEVLEEGESIGLDRAASIGARRACELGAGRALVLACDLPRLTEAALEQLEADARDHDVLIAPDEIGTGTNALLVPCAVPFDFRFGSDSCERHAAAARGRRYTIAVHRSHAIAFDVDTPEDYARWKRSTAKPVV